MTDDVHDCRATVTSSQHKSLILIVHGHRERISRSSAMVVGLASLVRAYTIALRRPTERQPLRNSLSFDRTCRRRSDVVGNMGRVPKQSNKAIKSLSGNRQDPGQPAILAVQSWCHDLTGAHLDEYKVVYDEFVEAVESEEVHRHSHSNGVTIPYNAVLRKAWDSGSIWYSHAH